MVISDVIASFHNSKNHEDLTEAKNCVRLLKSKFSFSRDEILTALVKNKVDSTSSFSLAECNNWLKRNFD